jgi:DNA polymerase-3 subunit delta'
MEANQEIKNFLAKTIQKNRVAHAYLFLGEAGAGKKDVAFWYEKKLNAKAGRIHLDRLLIEPQEGKGQIVLEQIQEIRNWLKFSSHQAHRVVVINPAEAMNSIAQNSLLKTLEEPTPRSVLILIANRIQGLTETILSRCQILRFSRTSQKEIRSWLKAEGLSNQKIEEIVFLSQGRVKEVKFWLEHPEQLSEEFTFLKNVGNLINRDLVGRIGWTEKMKKGVDLNRILNMALNLQHYFLLNKDRAGHQDLFSRLASDNSWSELVKHLKLIQETKTLLETTNVNKKLALNQLLINL